MSAHHEKRLITALSSTQTLSVNISSLFRLIARHAFGIMMIAATHAHAEPSIPPITSGSLEVGVLHSRLSEGNADWNDQYLRGNWQINPTGNINGEISNQSHFADQGVFIGAGYTHIFNNTWHGFLNTGASQGGLSFLPRIRVDASISRKWLKKNNLISTLGLGYYQAKTIDPDRSDRNLLLSALYYFDAPLIVEAGVRLNESSPGEVRSNRPFTVITYGKNQRYYLTLRYETGGEAWQVIDANTKINDFSSNEVSLIWRQWLSREYGFNLMTNFYNNYSDPGYTRFGVQFGLFHDF